MIDLPLLVLAGRHLAAVARRKGHQPFPYLGLMIFAGYGGALLGGYAAGVVHKAAGGRASDQNPYLIAGAVLGALTGLVVTYLRVFALRPAGPSGAEYDDYEDVRP